MADFHEHGVSYDQRLTELPVRELLFHSQTDQTKDAVEALEIAAAAYDKSRAEVADGSNDVTAPAEAAAKAGFRAEQADLGIEAVRAWFDRSHVALRDADTDTFQHGTRIIREGIATDLLEGRTYTLRNAKSDTHDTSLAADASAAFARADKEVRLQHMFGRPWDRYGTMLSRHRATGEARNWDLPRRRVAGIAAGGVWRAIRAKRENVSEPGPKDRKEHIRFVGKQAVLNVAAGVLGVTRPQLPGSKYDHVHKNVARKLLQ